MTKFRVGLAQLESRLGEADYDPRPANLERADQAVGEAKWLGADLVLLGEMFLTGCRSDEHNLTYALRIDQDDPALQAVVDLAARHGVHLVMGSATIRDTDPETVHNSALLVAPDGLMASYDKTHLAYVTEPNGTLHDETAWFGAGAELPVWPTASFGVLGPQICYDNHFAEVGRAQTVLGAESLLNISASAAGFEEIWFHLRAARAIENAAWFVNCSVVGEQKGERYFGRSAVVDPMGRLVVEAADGVEDIVVADIDLDQARAVRAMMNTLGSRRPDVYGSIVDRRTVARAEGETR